MDAATAFAAATAVLVALAGPVVDSASAAPIAVDDVRVRIVTDTQGAVVLARATLPSGTKLPAQLQLSVPTGVDLIWAGEILGGDPSEDIEAKYDRATGEGYDIITMTLTQSRTGQIEYRDAKAIATTGGQSTISVSWTSPVSAEKGLVALQVPNGAQVSDAGGAILDESTGSSFYQKALADVKAGDKIELRVIYAATGAPGATQQPGAAPQQPGAAPQQPGAAAPGSAPAQPASRLTLVIVGALLVGGTLYALRYVSSQSSGGSR